MSTFGLFLVLGSSLGWASFDVLRKLLVGKAAPMPLTFLLTALQVPLFGLWVALEGTAGPAPASWGYALPALGSVALNLVAMLAFFAAMKLSPLSATIPLLSLTPAFATLLAFLTLGQEPAGRELTGILTVVAGALLLNLDPARGSTFGAVLRALAREKGAWFMILVALMWSLTPSLDTLAMQRASPPFHGLVLTAGIALGVLLLLAVRGRLRELRPEPGTAGLLLAALLANALALGLQLKALEIVAVGLVETLKRGIGNFAALGVGKALFAEAITRHKIAAVVLMAAGVAMILI